jgi:Na+/H+-dicarboxylate symporter
MSSPSASLIDRKRPNLSWMILIGLIAGVASGLFFGEYTERIRWVGDAFVGLLQMAVLPFVAASLVSCVGRLSLADGAKLIRVGLLVMIALWAIGLTTLAILTQAFPVWEGGSFFSSRFTEPPPDPSWMDLFIPSNPFRALADNSIPAVVVFCIGLGVAIMNLPNKDRLLEPLDVLVDALANLNKLVVKLTPLGMFAIAAHAAGTIDFNQFKLIQGYLLTYGASAILLSLVVMPILIATVTPLTYGAVVRVSRDPLIAAFVIGNSFVVLPMMISAIDRLQRQIGNGRNPDDHPAEFLVPLAYPFPDVGRIVGLIFIPFSAWFYGSTIDMGTYPALVAAGLPGAFAKPIVTIPLLLDLAELPSDILNLWLASGVVAARFGDLMKTMHLMTFTLLVMCIMKGLTRFRPIRLLAGAVGSVMILALATLAIRTYLDTEFKDLYSKEKLITERDMKFPENSTVGRIETTLLERSNANPLPIGENQSRVQRIKEYGKLRVGFDPNSMPFCYFRADSRMLIGFDVQMAYYLAYDLNVGLEFVPIDRDNLYRQIEKDHFDVAMSALEGTVERAALMPSMDSYMDVTLAIVVPDHDKRSFRDRESMQEIPNLSLAIVKDSHFAERARRTLPEHIRIVEIDSASQYFEGLFSDVSGLVISAESGFAWTLRRPQFKVANPLQGRVHVPLYYMTGFDSEFESFLHNWLSLKRANGTYQDLYDYWILGLDSEAKPQRWCVIRDVLGWGK